MVTPIASPQNLIAIIAIRGPGGGSVSFVEWCGFGIPLAMVWVFCIWFVLRSNYKTNLPEGIEASFEPEMTEDEQGTSPAAAEKSGFDGTELFIMLVITGTILMWIVFDSLSETFGNIGIVALIPVIVFFGTGLLSKEDFDALPWNVIILMGGGLALGTAVQSSGLLDLVANAISSAMEGRSVWLVMLVFNAVVGIVANFVSSTVSAIIFLPLIAKVGLQVNHVNTLCISAALMTSGAMGLPVSSFPNANAYAISWGNGKPMLENGDYLLSGFTMTAIVYVTLATAGYALSLAYGW